MSVIETPQQGRILVAKYLRSGINIPQDVRDILERYTFEEPSSAVACVQMAELIYARANELPPELLDIGAQMAIVCATWDFHGFRSNDNRGFAIAKSLRDRPGVTRPIPAPSQLTPPAPSDQFSPTRKGEQ